MKECKDIYELKDILYEKFDYWDVAERKVEGIRAGRWESHSVLRRR